MGEFMGYQKRCVARAGLTGIVDALRRAVITASAPSSNESPAGRAWTSILVSASARREAPARTRFLWMLERGEYGTARPLAELAQILTSDHPGQTFRLPG